MTTPDTSLVAASSNPSWFGSELRARVVSALVLAMVAIASTYNGGWPFALLWLGAGGIIVTEWLAMVDVQRRASLAWTAILGLTACSLAIVLHAPGWIAPAALAVSGLGLALAAESGRDRVWAIGGLACAAVLVASMPLLRDQAPYGLVIILWMFAVVWTTDIAAYFAGRHFGGPKLWPAVSPKKTWSGAVAGLLAGSLAGLGIVLAGSGYGGFTPPFGPAVLATGSALASIAGQLGDLAESALKRHGGVKDSGRLIPGHGGVMDRLDALWAVALLAGIGLAGSRLVQQ